MWGYSNLKAKCRPSKSDVDHHLEGGKCTDGGHQQFLMNNSSDNIVWQVNYGGFNGAVCWRCPGWSETGWFLEPGLVFHDDLIRKKKDKCTEMSNSTQEHIITLKRTVSGGSRAVFGVQRAVGGGDVAKP